MSCKNFVKSVEEITKKVESLKELESVEQLTDMIDSVMTTFMEDGNDLQTKLMDTLNGLNIKDPVPEVIEEEPEPKPPEETSPKVKKSKKSK